jgi:hypothetical protein
MLPFSPYGNLPRKHKPRRTGFTFGLASKLSLARQRRQCSGNIGCASRVARAIKRDVGLQS